MFLIFGCISLNYLPVVPPTRPSIRRMLLLLPFWPGHNVNPVFVKARRNLLKVKSCSSTSLRARTGFAVALQSADSTRYTLGEISELLFHNSGLQYAYSPVCCVSLPAILNKNPILRLKVLNIFSSELKISPFLVLNSKQSFLGLRFKTFSFFCLDLNIIFFGLGLKRFSPLF